MTALNMYTIQGRVLSIPIVNRLTFMRGESGIGKTASLKATVDMHNKTSKIPMLYINEESSELTRIIESESDRWCFVLDHWETLCALNPRLPALVRECTNHSFIIVGREKRGLPVKGMCEYSLYLSDTGALCYSNN